MACGDWRSHWSKFQFEILEVVMETVRGVDHFRYQKYVGFSLEL